MSAGDGFLIEHRLTIRSTCPVDGTEDVYNALLCVDRTVAVETILAAVAQFTAGPIYQEELTKALAQRFDAEVVTNGIHSGVYTTCRYLP